MADDAMQFAGRATLAQVVRPKKSATPHPNPAIGLAMAARFPRPRAQVGFGVVVAHVVGICVLASSTYARRTEPVLQVLEAALVQTNNAANVSIGLAPQVSRVKVLQDPLEPVLALPPPPQIVLEEANVEAVSVAPRLRDEAPPDVAPYARLGGLLPGESALVVVRVEILPDGTTGDIQVDVSSGSDQVDKAAVAYARLIAWVPGRLHGIGERTWVRQGVRLVA